MDVVGLHVNNKHLIHIECSLDALPWPVREQRFAKKFEQGRRHVRAIFAGIALPETLDQVVLLQFAGRNAPDKLGGGRLVTGKQFVREVFDGLEGTDPASGAVPSTFPLLRMLQLAAAAQETSCDPLTSGDPSACLRNRRGSFRRGPMTMRSATASLGQHRGPIGHHSASLATLAAPTTLQAREHHHHSSERGNSRCLSSHAMCDTPSHGRQPNMK